MDTNKEFKEIVNNYNKNIKFIARKFFSTHQEIDDVEQEVYIKAWKYKDKFRGESSLWTWMRTITVNTCKDHLKKIKKHKDNTISDDEKILHLQDSHANIESDLAGKERQQFILSKINKLKPKFKEVIILHDIDELTHEEISIKIGCPLGTVKSRLFNARKALMQELHDLL